MTGGRSDDESGQREVLLAGAWGGAAAVPVGLLVLLFGGSCIPTPSHPLLVVSVAVGLGANVLYLALCFILFRRFVRRPLHGALAYGATFASVNFVLDSALLLTAFRHPEWFSFLTVEQVQSIAAFLPLAYLGMIAVPLACERMYRQSTS